MSFDSPKTKVSTVSVALGKPESQKEKRSHSEVADSSIGDEFTSIHKQLYQLGTDIQQTREEFKSLMKKEEMKNFISSSIKKMFTDFQKKLESSIEEKIERKVEEKMREKVAELSERMDLLTYENVQLKEQNDELRNRVMKNEKSIQSTMEKSNMNEQFSRKNNIKIMGVQEEEDETEESLTEKVSSILDKKAGVSLNVNRIVAIHRIPGKSGMPKPVLLKLMNNNEKTKIMKKRKQMKVSGYRLVDDVTKQNTKLINRLNLHSDLEAAWYFNGNVYAKTKQGKRYRFDLFTDVDDLIKIKSGREGASERRIDEVIDSK